jgi:hypothetical protein
MEQIMKRLITIALLSIVSSSLGMELPPRLKAPATSAAAHAINQPMIKVYSPSQHVDTIQRNYLEASATLKNMLEDVDANQALVLPNSMIEDYLAIKDLLSYEHRLIAETTDKKTALDLLKSKTEQQLTAILNACQRFELNKVGELAITLLTEKLNTQAKKDACLKTGSYNLDWTPDVARLVAQKMRKDNQFFYMVLTNLTERKQGEAYYWHILQDNTGTRRESSATSFLLRHQFGHFLAYNSTYWLSEHPELIVDQKWCQAQELINNPTILVNQISDKDGTATLYWQIDSEILKIANSLKPEQVTILIKYLTKTDQMPLHLQEKLPRSIRQLLFPNWWQRRSWLSKAAIITGGFTATGLATWYGYKYFHKK